MKLIESIDKFINMSHKDKGNWNITKNKYNDGRCPFCQYMKVELISDNYCFRCPFVFITKYRCSDIVEYNNFKDNFYDIFCDEIMNDHDGKIKAKLIYNSNILKNLLLQKFGNDRLISTYSKDIIDNYLKCVINSRRTILENRTNPPKEKINIIFESIKYYNVKDSFNLGEGVISFKKNDVCTGYTAILPISPLEFRENNNTKAKAIVYIFENVVVFKIYDDYGILHEIVITSDMDELIKSSINSLKDNKLLLNIDIHEIV